MTHKKKSKTNFYTFFKTPNPTEAGAAKEAIDMMISGELYAESNWKIEGQLCKLIAASSSPNDLVKDLANYLKAKPSPG